MFDIQRLTVTLNTAAIISLTLVKGGIFVSHVAQNKMKAVGQNKSGRPRKHTKCRYQPVNIVKMLFSVTMIRKAGTLYLPMKALLDSTIHT